MYVASRKLTGSNPYEVIGFYNWLLSSSHMMALGPSNTLTEMSTRNLPRGEGRSALKADLTVNCELTVYEMWEPRHHTTL
jgi:hypothetical protein